MHPPTGSDARLIVFLFESPEPFMMPDGSTFSFVLDERLPWLPKMNMGVVQGGQAILDEAEGQLFVSFRLWRSSTTWEPPLPSDAFMEVLRRVMPSDKKMATRVGHVGLEEGDEVLERIREMTSETDPEESDADTDLEHPVTIVEAVTILLPSSHDASPVVEALHRCMESLAEFSRVYRLSNHLRMQTVTYERLPSSGIFWTTRRLLDDSGTKWDEGLELLLFPFRMPGKTQHEELNEGDLKRLTQYFERYRGGHPLIAYSERGLEARIAFDEFGDYANCVIQAQTAMEVLFDGLLSLLLWEEGQDPEAVATDIFSESLHKRIRTRFPPRLGGDWNTRGQGVIGRWAQLLVPLRNRIVHAAHRPSREEAMEALQVMREVDEFVRQRVVDRRTKYMRTALMFLGRPGLEHFGVWSGRIKKFVEEEADKEPNWLETFREWQQQVLAARQRVSVEKDTD